uniref:RFX-type winged-helix domain-containing protein n=1 Tax=Kalmanozyma brasiliensis (strain GHG001) TaxID=1365824 RepID=V5EXE6_KALBG
MSYPQHASPAGAAPYVAASPSVIRSQHLPYIPPQQQQHPGPGLPSLPIPHASGDPAVSFKRLKMIGDGFEAPYLVPGPSNRILLSLKSGLPSQIDWALSRLVSLTANHRDQAARDFTLDSVPGLADALLSFVRRIHAALTGQDPSKWAASYFEQSTEAPDVGIGAPGDGGHQGITTSQRALVHRSGPVNGQSSAFAFNPSLDPSHAALMRRALEAALSLRNMVHHTSNSRSLGSIKGTLVLIRDILRLPTTAVQRTSQDEAKHGASGSEHEEGWLEIEGIAELRLYFLDILEALANRVTLTRRAASVPAPSKALSIANGSDATKADTAPTAGDDIFATLLSLALHSKDRAFLMGSLRCLTTLAANDRNEVAFVEVTLPNGEQSPGLLQRCVELLPLTQDVELLEVALDLLYQLVCIGNNAIKIAAPLPIHNRQDESQAPREARQQNGISKGSSAQTASARANANTTALIRLLSRNLQLGRIMWERLIPLKVPSAWFASIPNRHAEAVDRRRELQMRIANETPQERAKRKKLTPKERKRLLGLQEPERGIAWMSMVFDRDGEQEVTQMEFWTAYKEEFALQSDGVPLQPAAELIRAVGQVFPNAQAMVVPKTDTTPQRFVIKGITVRERDIELLEPFRCHWSTCPAPQTNSLESQRSHAKVHAQYASDGRCRWRRCDFDAKSSSTAAGTVKHQQALVAHVLTHVRSDEEGGRPAKQSKRTDIVVDENLRVVSGAEHTGEAAKLVAARSSHGGRTLRGKRDADGVETALTLGKTSDRGSAAVNGAANGRKAPSSAAPSDGTVDNPGTYLLDVTRTPTVGNNDENPSPQGPAYTSILILRMLTRRAASLLQKAGSKRSEQDEDEQDAAAIRGQGDEKFGLPLPANFGASERGSKHGQPEDDQTPAQGDAGEVSVLDNEEEDYETTETWAVDAATRLLDAVEGVEEDLMHHSSQNDILSSYINETLLELRRRPAGTGLTSTQLDPRML